SGLCRRGDAGLLAGPVAGHGHLCARLWHRQPHRHRAGGPGGRPGPAWRAALASAAAEENNGQGGALMAFVQPVTLRDRGVRLEPLNVSHEAGLRAAAADGELWKLRITSVPEPEHTRKYIDDAIQMRADGNRFAFAVVDDASGTVLGSTSFHDILPAVKRVEIGWTWYRQSVQRTHVNTTAKLLMMGHTCR